MNRKQWSVGLVQFVFVCCLHSQNLLVNPDFDSDLQGWGIGFWTPDWISDGFFSWGAVEVTASASGSFGSVALEQCVGVADGPHLLRVAYRESGDSTVTGGAKLRLVWYAGPNCTSPLGQVHDIDPVLGILAWQVYLHNHVVPPDGTTSALVMIIQSVDAAGSYIGHWDYLLFEPTPIFSNGFESGNTTAWN